MCVDGNDTKRQIRNEKKGRSGDRPFFDKWFLRMLV
jgi:hypothetical protein